MINKFKGMIMRNKSKEKEKKKERSLKKEGIAGIKMIALAIIAYTMKNCSSSIEAKVIFSAATTLISFVLASDIIDTLIHIIKGARMMKRNINETKEIERREAIEKIDDFLNLEQSKIEIAICVVVHAIVIVVGIAIIFTLVVIWLVYRGQDPKWVINIINPIKDVIAVVSIANVAGKSFYNLMTRKYIEEVLNKLKIEKEKDENQKNDSEV